MSSWNKKPANPVRDYSRRTYGNPLFKPAGGTVRRGGNSRPVRRGSSGDGAGLGMKALLAAVVLLLGVAAWYAFWSPALAVTGAPGLPWGVLVGAALARLWRWFVAPS